MYQCVGLSVSLTVSNSTRLKTPFMDFVESIQSEGVELERKAMGEGSKPKTPLIVEVDNENDKKDIAALDIEIPVLTPRTCREYKSLEELNPAGFDHKKVVYKQFSAEAQRQIVFKDIYHRGGQPHHYA